MILLEVESLVKHYGPEPVLAGVTCEIRPGDRIGLVGPNGAGKTTLMKIIAGREDADSGTCTLHASARLAYLEQQPEFKSGRNVWDETYSGLAEQVALVAQAEQAAHDLAASEDPASHARLAARYDRLQHEVDRRGAYQLDRQVEKVLTGLGFARDTFEQPVELLSGGQQNRLLLAKLLLAGADLMLLDEPSNHLDIEATEWLENFLSESRQAMLIVSHDRYFLDKVTNRTLELFDGTVDSYPGNFSAYWRQKEERLEVAARTYDKQQEFIAKTEDFIRRNFAGQKSNQAEDRRKKLARIERVAPPRTIAAPPMAFPPAERSGDIVVRVEHLCKGYARPLFADLTWDVLRGERWGILGPNGSGKTTLLRCLVREEKPDSGIIVLGTGVRMAYYDQLLSGVADDAPVVEAIRPPHKEFTEPERRSLLARFGLTGDIVFQQVRSLSGGERSRAALARLAGLDANLLVLDEPTNHLDLWARDALERALTQFDGTLIFVSHDRYFLNRVADHLLVVEPGRFRVVEGNYESYRDLVRQGRAREATSRDALPSSSRGEKGPQIRSSDRAAKSAESSDKNAKKRRRFPFRKVDEIELEIAEREARIEQLHADLATPAVLRDGDRVRSSKAEIESQQQALATLYEHWEEASELNW